MIYMVASDGKQLTVDDGEGDSFTLPTRDAGEAWALVSKAKTEGVEAIRPAKKATKK